MTILGELQRQVTLEQYNEQRNHWNFLAAVITNNFSRVVAKLSKRRQKIAEPDDFISKDAKKMFQKLLGQDETGQKSSQNDWEKHIKDAKAKGLRGPWSKGGEKIC